MIEQQIDKIKNFRGSSWCIGKYLNCVLSIEIFVRRLAIGQLECARKQQMLIHRDKSCIANIKSHRKRVNDK